MNFVLRYRGPLSGKPQKTKAEKHHIREAFSPQLRELCKRASLFGDALRSDLHSATLKGERIVPPRDENGNLEPPFFWRVPLAGHEFVPLVTRPHELVCELDILWLRREKPGDIVHGGDLDNRLKSLLDGLRMPHEEKELPNSLTGGDTFLCLLEDDALIQRIGVTTYELLEPRGHATAEQKEVDLILNVLVKSTYPMYANIGFPV
jgi:hypothetical protein